MTTTGLVAVRRPEYPTQGVFLPHSIFGYFTLLAGVFQGYSNGQRLATMPAQYAQSQAEFFQAERNRFEGINGVNAWWMSLKVLWPALAIAGMLCRSPPATTSPTVLPSV